MNTEIGIRFSEEKYCTKEEIKEIYNMSSIDHIWEQVLDYRRNYTFTLDLRNLEGSPFSIVLCPKIINKINAFERKLLKIILKYSKISDDNKQQLLFSCLKKGCNDLNVSYKFQATTQIIDSIVEGNLGTIPSQYSMLHFYANTQKYFASHFYDVFDYRLLQHINSYLLGNNLSLLDSVEKIYRVDDIDPIKEHYTLNQPYKAAPKEKIAESIDGFCNFINEDEVSPLIQFVTTLFYIYYIKPFDFYNEEIAEITSKIVLARKDFEIVPFLMNIDKMFIFNKEQTEKVFLEVQKTLDITYAVDYVLNYFDGELNDILNSFVNISVNDVKKEYAQTDEVDSKPIETSQENNAIRRVYNFTKEEVSPIEYEKKVALPVVPKGLSEEDANLVSEDLRQMYPFLRKIQCDFYAHHCTVGKHYTIQDFKNSENTAYETARTSMDMLAENGFYEKKKVRNKFVYCPINKE